MTDSETAEQTGKQPDEDSGQLANAEQLAGPGGEDQPQNLDAMLERMPEPVREVIKTSLQISSHQSSSVSPLASIIGPNVKPEHISSLIGNSEKEAQRQHDRHRHDRIATLVAFALLLAFLVFLIIWLGDQEEVLERVFSFLAGIFAGVVGGFGYGLQKRSEAS